MAKNQYQLVTFFLNGKEVERMVDVRASLTDMLRNDFSMTSVKKGCEVGECGACNVLIDGECYNSCLYLAVWAEGKHITTLEGLMGPKNAHHYGNNHSMPIQWIFCLHNSTLLLMFSLRKCHRTC